MRFFAIVVYILFYLGAPLFRFAQYSCAAPYCRRQYGRLARLCARRWLRAYAARLARLCARRWLRAYAARLARLCARRWLRAYAACLARLCARRWLRAYAARMALPSVGAAVISRWERRPYRDGEFKLDRRLSMLLRGGDVSPYAKVIRIDEQATEDGKPRKDEPHQRRIPHVLGDLLIERAGKKTAK